MSSPFQVRPEYNRRLLSSSMLTSSVVSQDAATDQNTNNNSPSATDHHMESEMATSPSLEENKHGENGSPPQVSSPVPGELANSLKAQYLKEAQQLKEAHHFRRPFDEKKAEYDNDQDEEGSELLSDVSESEEWSDSSTEPEDSLESDIDDEVRSQRKLRRSKLRISIIGELATVSPDNGGGRFRQLKDVKALLNSGYDGNYDNAQQPIWICVENATRDDIGRIGEHFDLHQLTTEDCQSRHTREKLEIFQSYLFLVFHSLHQEPAPEIPLDAKLPESIGKGTQSKKNTLEVDTFVTSHNMSAQAAAEEAALQLSLLSDTDIMRTIPIKLIVFPHFILTFSPERLQTLRRVRKRLAKAYDNRLESTVWLIHAILDAIVDALLPVVESTVLEVDALEDLIYLLSGSEHRDLLRRMGLTRRRLTFLRQRLWSKRDILTSLIGRDWQVFLTDVQVPYLRDVYDHVVTMIHKAESGTDLLGALQTTYLANVSIDVTEQSKESNFIMKQLTAVATIVLPLTLIAGILGMNCTVPWQSGNDGFGTWNELAPFFTICFGMVIVSVLMVAYFKKQNLI